MHLQTSNYHRLMSNTYAVYELKNFENRMQIEHDNRC